MQINLFDTCFEHDVGMVRHRKPSYFDWDRERRSYDGATVYTHRAIFPSNPDKSILMLWESENISASFCSTEKVLQHAQYYKYIFTHRYSILSALPDTAKFIPGGEIWVPDDEIKIYNKSKLVSIVSSDKNMCPLHNLRMRVATSGVPELDVYGTIVKKWSEPKDYLYPYYFSVAIENNIDKWYFTEKLLNCFATGTIPIYIGAYDLSQFFNMDGVIVANQNDVMDIISNLSVVDYENRKEAIEDNFQRCQQYKCIEDWWWLNYKDILEEML